MTHIIINIAELKAKAKRLRQASVPEYHAIANSYDKLIQSGKQISLDGEDIENKFPLDIDKAPINYSSEEAFAWIAGNETGYKQALLDLKN